MVEDFYDFYFLCCPECAYKSKDALAFFDHAIENHPKSRAHVVSEVEPSYEAPESPGYWIPKPLPDGIAYNTPDGAIVSPVSPDTSDNYNRVHFNNPASTPRNIYNSPNTSDNYNRVHFNTPASTPKNIYNSTDTPYTPATPKNIYYSPNTPDTYDRVHFNSPATPKNTYNNPDMPDNYNRVHFNTPATPIKPPDAYPDTQDTYPDNAPDAFHDTEWTPPVQDEENIMKKTNVESYQSGKFTLYWTRPDRINKTPFKLKLTSHILSNQGQNSQVHEEMKPCEPKTSRPLKLVGSVHEEKKPLQCDESEMLKEEEMENAGEALASESDLKLHKSTNHEEKKHKKRYI